MMTADVSKPAIPALAASAGPKRMNVFERYLSVWVAKAGGHSCPITGQVLPCPSCCPANATSKK